MSSRDAMIGIPFFWLLVFFLVPFLIVLKISVAESLIASPPFSSLVEFLDDGTVTMRLVLENYAYLWEDPLYTVSYTHLTLPTILLV